MLNCRREAGFLSVVASIFAALLFVVGCGRSSDNPETADRNLLIKMEMARLLDRAIADDKSLHGIVLRVEAPDRGLVCEDARGWADEAHQQKMVAGDLFRAASIGKMTCAALVMKLVEKGDLGLDDKISRYLPATLMNGLHVYQGTSFGDRITVRQLLGHTTGLADYIQDGDVNDDGIPDFLELLMEHPEKFWTPEETIEYTKANLPPLFPPGQGFHYSDTNYQLLGLILERVSGIPLNEAYREMIFNPIGMNHTYMEFYDLPRPAVPGRGLSHVYYGNQDYTDWTSVSADWAGGGIATTAYDLSRFLRLFSEDKIFEKRSTKGEMTNWVSAGSPGCYYGYGIMRIVQDEIGLKGFDEVWGHIGFPNSFAFYWPKQNVTIVGTLNQALPQAEDAYSIAMKVLTILGKYP